MSATEGRELVLLILIVLIGSSYQKWKFSKTVSSFNSSTVQDPTNAGAMLDTRKWRTCALTRMSASSKTDAPRAKSALTLLEVMSVNVRRVRRPDKVPVSVGFFQKFQLLYLFEYF